jgi:hypothetical protein
MPETIEAAIHKQLREVTSDEVMITEIHVMSDDINRFGRPFTARDRLRQIYQRRVRNGRQRKIEDPWLDKLEAALIALDAMSLDERLYSWTAKGPNGYFSGISTAIRPILLSTNDLDHNPIT